ncbi:MAG: hypothetical protein HYU27_04155 [Acidobacteria bacterium]|nr:hypothetical protein [Acidobacteriota bacterium]
MIGSRLSHYDITGHLGSGGMGEVYQATDSKLGRSVVIKLLLEAQGFGDLFRNPALHPPEETLARSVPRASRRERM